MLFVALILATWSFLAGAQTGDDCWGPCGSGGYCGWCNNDPRQRRAGVSQACCRYAWSDPSECQQAWFGPSAPVGHHCVALNNLPLSSGPLSGNDRWYVADNMGWRNVKRLGRGYATAAQCKKKCEVMSACNAINVGKGGTANLCETFQYPLEHAKYARNSMPMPLANDGGWTAYFVRKGVHQVGSDYEMTWLCRDMVGLENCPEWTGRTYEGHNGRMYVQAGETYETGYRTIVAVGASALLLIGLYGCIKKSVKGEQSAVEAGLV